MGLKDRLFAIEEGFWTGGEEYFRAHRDEDCALAFPQMAGGCSPVRTKDRGFLHPIDDLAMLDYEAHAVRADGEPYRALVSTGYVRRGDGWKMAFHSRTPLVGH